jgi:hypothetical protein
MAEPTGSISHCSVRPNSVPQNSNVDVAWQSAAPVRSIDGDPSRFVDAAALLVPGTEAAQAMTMGGPADPVEGLLWRADAERPLAVAARGWIAVG